MAWTEERLARFKATMARKKRQKPAAAAPTAEGASISVNGKSISLEDALAVHAAVEQLKRRLGNGSAQ